MPPNGVAKLDCRRVAGLQGCGAFDGSISGLVQQSGTLDLYSMQIRPAPFEGESVSVTDLLADMGSTTLDELTAQGNVADQLLCTDVSRQA